MSLFSFNVTSVSVNQRLRWIERWPEFWKTWTGQTQASMQIRTKISTQRNYKTSTFKVPSVVRNILKMDFDAEIWWNCCCCCCYCCRCRCCCCCLRCCYCCCRRWSLQPLTPNFRFWRKSQTRKIRSLENWALAKNFKPKLASLDKAEKVSRDFML